MTASKLVLASLCLAGLGVAGCTTIHQGPDRVVSGYAVAQDCLTRAEGGPTATPQVMIYDPQTKVETHVLETQPLVDDGNGGLVPAGEAAHVMTVQHRDTNEVVALAAKAPIDPNSPHNGYFCSADGQGEAYSQSYATTSPNPMLIGAVAGAIVGNAATHTGQGTREGAVIGATMGANMDPASSNAIAGGAVVGALLGGSDTGAAAQGAIAGGVVGASVAKDGYAFGYHRDGGSSHDHDKSHGDGKHRDSRKHHNDDGW